MGFADGEMESERYIHREVFSFLRQGTARLIFKLLNSLGQHKHTLDFQDKMRLYGGGSTLAGPTPIPGADLDPHWIPFWVDMRKTGRIVVGTGATVLVNFTATDGEVLLPFLKFNVFDTGEKIIYCDKKGV